LQSPRRSCTLSAGGAAPTQTSGGALPLASSATCYNTTAASWKDILRREPLRRRRTKEDKRVRQQRLPAWGHGKPPAAAQARPHTGARRRAEKRLADTER